MLTYSHIHITHIYTTFITNNTLMSSNIHLFYIYTTFTQSNNTSIHQMLTNQMAYPPSAFHQKFHILTLTNTYPYVNQTHIQPYIWKTKA